MSNSLLFVSIKSKLKYLLFLIFSSLNRITFTAYTSIGCRCLAAFDRYACTSRSITLREWSSTKMAWRFLIGNIVIWACFALPNFLFFDLIPIGPTRVMCYISNQIYSDYFAYFVNPVMYFGLPLIILISFAIQTHRNLRLMRRSRRLKRLERQMTSVKFETIFTEYRCFIFYFR